MSISKLAEQIAFSPTITGFHLREQAAALFLGPKGFEDRIHDLLTTSKSPHKYREKFWGNLADPEAFLEDAWNKGPKLWSLETGLRVGFAGFFLIAGHCALETHDPMPTLEHIEKRR